jgi:hypothetical protein
MNLGRRPTRRQSPCAGQTAHEKGHGLGTGGVAQHVAGGIIGLDRLREVAQIRRADTAANGGAVDALSGQVRGGRLHRPRPLAHIGVTLRQHGPDLAHRRIHCQGSRDFHVALRNRTYGCEGGAGLPRPAPPLGQPRTDPPTA